MKTYKGYKYFKDKDNLWKVILKNSMFVVALDDSKFISGRNIIDEKNNEQTCIEFIDLISKNA